METRTERAEPTELARAAGEAGTRPVGVRSAYSVARPVDNEYLVRERDRRRLRDLAVILLVLSPVALALLVFTWIHLEVLDSSYRIDELERNLAELEREESRLRLESAFLSSPTELERRARDELGMAPPPLDHVYYYRGEEAP